MNVIIATLSQFSLVGLILIGLSYKRHSFSLILLAVLLYTAFLFDTVLLLLPKSHYFSNLHWNWQGKLLEFTWPLVVVYILKWLTPNEVGLRLPKSGWCFLYVSIIALIYNVAIFSVSIFTGSMPKLSDVNHEGILFQLIMPGLAEELFFRGILWAVISRYLQIPITIFKLKIGWNFIFTTILFIMVHLIIIHTKTGHIEWLRWLNGDNINIFIPAIMLGITRAKTSSIWPCVIFHNLLNGLFFLMVRLLYY